MGKRLRFVAALSAAALYCGCQATDQVKGIVRKTGMRTSTTPDPIAFNQVPERNRAESIAAAEALRLARERNKLAEMRVELTKVEADLAKEESVAAASRLDERTALFRKSKFEAIDKTGLGDKEENIAAIGKLASRATKHESDALRSESKATILKRRAEQRRAEVDAQAKKVASLEGP
tara:strand:- start:149 stop:682 length:534 start_codon:yes stop_codon:yes gene_type:complete